MKGKIKKGICLALVVSMLAGCNTNGNQIEEVLSTEKKATTEIKKAGAVSLAEPESKVNTLVDLKGYNVGDDKTVYFVETSTKEKFNIIDVLTKEIVYQSDIKEDEEIFIGDFSDFDLPGNYYIETNEIGRSYEFSIDENIWQNRMWDLLNETEGDSIANNKESITDTALGIHVLLLALSCYPTVFEQDNTLITWLLKTADTIRQIQGDDGSFYNDYETTAICAGIMLMCSERFGKYNEEMSAQFEETANKAYNWMKLNDNDKNEEALFYYMCQCFNFNKDEATFKNEIEEYIENNLDELTSDMYLFLGACIYINSEKNTDRDICTKVMQNFVLKTEEISKNVKKYPFLVNSDSLDEALEDVLLICFIDYITPSREYMDIIKNTMHYLSGTNMQNEIYIRNADEWNIFFSSICLFCYSDINN